VPFYYAVLLFSSLILIFKIFSTSVVNIFIFPVVSLTNELGTITILVPFSTTTICFGLY
jgi:hypothetical protein